MEDEQEDRSQNQQQKQHNRILSDGKLKIKLKINPKNLEDEIVHDFYQDEDDFDDQIISPILNNTDKKQNTTKNNNSRVCSECYKEFSSGKALGGHMRIHAQALKKKHHHQHQLNQNTTMFKKHGKSSEEDSIVFYLDKNKKKRDYGDDYRKPICSLCGKKFPSMKSLFGHMRCHPEREWRGIQPPKQFEKINNSFSYSSLSHDEEEEKFNGGGDGDEASPVVDLAQTLVPWSVKARRGRKGIRGSSAAAASSSDFSGSEEEEDEEEDEKLRNAVNDLMMLKQLVTFEATNSNSVTNNNEIEHDSNRVLDLKKKNNKKKRRLIEEEAEEYPVEADDDDYYPVMKKLRIEKNGVDHMAEKGKGKADFVENHAPLLDKEYCSDGEESDSRNTELMPMNQNYKYFDVKNKKKVKKMKLMMDLDSLQEHENPEFEPEKYKCSTCNKCFPSHQALGGHRSSHNKFKITIIDQNQKHQHQASSAAVVPDHHHHHQEFDQQQFEQPHQQQQRRQADTDEELTNKEISSDSTAHQCRICNKTFPSGQALGGHKRCHRAGPVLELAPAASADQAQLAQAPSRQFTSSGEEEASQNAGSSRQMMEFDLNELPPMEDYDVGNAAAAAAGYSYGYC